MSQLHLHPDGRNTVRAAVTPAEPYPPIVEPPPDPQGVPGAPAAYALLAVAALLLCLTLAPVVLVLLRVTQ